MPASPAMAAPDELRLPSLPAPGNGFPSFTQATIRSMRPRTRRAVSGTVVQMPATASLTMAASMEATARLPSLGKACWASV